METFDLFAVRLPRASAGEAYALAIYPATKQPETAHAPRSIQSYESIDQLCDYLDERQFGSEPDIMILRLALPDALESENASFHLAQINGEGARSIGFQV
jgi:hypothetical protein